MQAQDPCQSAGTEPRCQSLYFQWLLRWAQRRSRFNTPALRHITRNTSLLTRSASITRT